MQKETVGFIGLGTMGMPMAKNLLKGGYRLSCYDLNPRALEEIAQEGAAVCASVAQAARDSDILVTILPADRQIREVYTAPGGVLDAARSGALCIEMTSALGDTLREVEQEAARRSKELQLVDAPVSGGVAGAQDGTLTIMVGGSAAAVERAHPVLRLLGTKIIPTGGLGSGKNVKLVNQLLNAANTYLASEAWYLGRRLGLEPDTLLRILCESTASSWVLQNNFPKFVLPGAFEGGFRLELMNKDLSLARGQAQKDGIALPVTEQIAAIYQAMVDKGEGKKNYMVVSRWIEQLNLVNEDPPPSQSGAPINA